MLHDVAPRANGWQIRVGEKPMAVQKIDKSEWRGFFDWLSKGLVGARTEVEVASLDLGDQIEVEWLPLLGITYDDKDDVLDVALEGVDRLVDHLIQHPREIWADPTT